METTLKVFAITGITIGGLALLSCLETWEPYTFIGSAMFIAWGIVSLKYIKFKK